MDGWKRKPVFEQVHRYSLKERQSKVEISLRGKVYEKGSSFLDFFYNFPDVLAAKDLRYAVNAIVDAKHNKKPVILGMGAHPVKTGLSPVIIDLIEHSIVTAIATNGATTIHDFEMALAGVTSEDVGPHLECGSFGMALETGVYLNNAIKDGVKKGYGLGQSIGEFIYADNCFSYKDMSILSTAYRLNVPVTVHVAVGTDIIHMHPEADGASIGDGSLRDFYRLAEEVCSLEGGVFINLGSAVIIPEVFLKVLNLARNTGHKIEHFTTINMDFIKHYRAHVNVLTRPVGDKGRSVNLIGHHEIMLPLLVSAVKELI